jgi:hypothetical protein
MVISIINSFNQLGVGFRVDPTFLAKRQAA